MNIYVRKLFYMYMYIYICIYIFKYRYICSSISISSVLFSTWRVSTRQKVGDRLWQGKPRYIYIYIYMLIYLYMHIHILFLMTCACLCMPQKVRGVSEPISCNLITMCVRMNVHACLFVRVYVRACMCACLNFSPFTCYMIHVCMQAWMCTRMYVSVYESSRTT